METLSLQTLAPFISSSFIFYGEALEERESEGAGTSPLPWPLRNKGMQLEGQRFLEQYGWGEKVITCLGFHCGNGHTFPWESLVSGGTERGERGGGGSKGAEKGLEAAREERERERGFFIFFFLCMWPWRG